MVIVADIEAERFLGSGDPSGRRRARRDGNQTTEVFYHSWAQIMGERRSPEKISRRTGRESTVSHIARRCDLLSGMRKPFPVATLLVIGAVAPLAAQVAITQGDNQIDVSIDGKPYTTFFYGPKVPKPYLYPLRAPSGISVTRGFPMDPHPGESTDHPPPALALVRASGRERIRLLEQRILLPAGQGRPHLRHEDRQDLERRKKRPDPRDFRMEAA